MALNAQRMRLLIKASGPFMKKHRSPSRHCSQNGRRPLACLLLLLPYDHTPLHLSHTLMASTVHPGIADSTWYLKSDDTYLFSWVVSRVRSVAPFLGPGQPVGAGAISSIYVSVWHRHCTPLKGCCDKTVHA